MQALTDGDFSMPVQIFFCRIWNKNNCRNDESVIKKFRKLKEFFFNWQSATNFEKDIRRWSSPLTVRL